jgi:hypothetical protein
MAGQAQLTYRFYIERSTKNLRQPKSHSDGKTAATSLPSPTAPTAQASPRHKMQGFTENFGRTNGLNGAAELRQEQIPNSSTRPLPE